MTLHVQCQVVRPGKGTFAEVALKGTVTGMLAKVACQLIGASEFPSATLPVAVIWLFTCWKTTEEKLLTFVFICFYFTHSINEVNFNYFNDWNFLRSLASFQDLTQYAAFLTCVCAVMSLEV